MDASLQAVHWAKVDLAGDLLRSAGEVRIRALGSSMLPAIRPGDELLVRRCGIEEVNDGDVIVFVRDRRIFAHRAIGRIGPNLRARGDAVAKADPEVRADELLGRVIELRRPGRAGRASPGRTLCSRVVAAFIRRSRRLSRLATRICASDRPAGA